MELFNQTSTGMKGLNEVIHNLRKGDNIVWQVDAIQDYKYFVAPFVENALKNNRTVVYLRFADHEALLEPKTNIKIYKLDAYRGFESFTYQIHTIIKQEGEGVYYVFDCLSSLLNVWATDLMVGNFFVVTCPYLYELNTVTYFALLRNNHSFKTIARIRETTQVLIDLYNSKGDYYVHPLKVWNRYSPTMFLPHRLQDNVFKPLSDSVEASKIFTHIYERSVESAKRNLDYWDKLFITAEELNTSPHSAEEIDEMLDKLCRVMIGRDERILSLVKNFVTLEDLLQIKTRLVGTGFIGGKTVGMLTARNILLKDTEYNWHEILEPHDSFYIGSDVFYTYIVQNGWWKLWMDHKTEAGYFEAGAVLKEKMLKGVFPEEVREQFQQVIEYYGQSPIIIRSSSLLEDSFGSAFAGKYESIFCVNQGIPEQRYINFEDSVRKIFASTMNENALAYRKQRGLWQNDEQMALLIQRVSGAQHKHYFFPDMAGVGVSYNIFKWKEDMDSQAGMLRLVFGLGTRAVNRVETDYPRIVALDMPLVKPHAGMEETMRFSQHGVDVLNIEENILQTVPLSEFTHTGMNFDWQLLAVKVDFSTLEDRFRPPDRDIWVLTFDELMLKTKFPFMMRRILAILNNAYHYPVEIELTVNFVDDKNMKINVLQCRPFQAREVVGRVEIPSHIRKNNILFKSHGFFMGGSIAQKLSFIVYVDPKAYNQLILSEKYDIARLIGSINKKIENRETMPVILFGPGRWGTTTPSLGVPVSFAEIHNVTVMVEISYISANLMPELSFGTHFFQDLVETNIFYVALFTERKEVFFNTQWFNSLPNVLEKIVEGSKKYEHAVKVYEVKGRGLKIMADIVSQDIVCFAEK